MPRGTSAPAAIDDGRKGKSPERRAFANHLPYRPPTTLITPEHTKNPQPTPPALPIRFRLNPGLPKQTKSRQLRSVFNDSNDLALVRSVRRPKTKLDGWGLVKETLN